MALIRSIAFLHQHQRPTKTVATDSGEVSYIEATDFDVALANRLAAVVIGHALDELPPGTRELLEALHAWVASRGDRSFTRRDARGALGVGDTQLKVHLARLVDMELVTATRGANNALTYELAWDGQGSDGSRFVVGIHNYDADRSGAKTGRSGGGRPPVGPVSGGGRDGPDGRDWLNPEAKSAFDDSDALFVSNALDRGNTSSDVVVAHASNGHH